MNRCSGWDGRGPHRDLGPDRQTLYYTVGYAGPLYRVVLPDGKPERIADGHGVSVSPDGQRLAFVRNSVRS